MRLRQIVLNIIAVTGLLVAGHAMAATNSTTLQTSYARASAYRAVASASDDARPEEDCSGRDCGTKATSGTAGKSSAGRRGGRDDVMRPRWHSTLPGMLR